MGVKMAQSNFKSYKVVTGDYFNIFNVDLVIPGKRSYSWKIINRKQSKRNSLQTNQKTRQYALESYYLAPQNKRQEVTNSVT